MTGVQTCALPIYLLVIKVSIRHADDRLQGDLCRDARIEPIRRQGEDVALSVLHFMVSDDFIVAILRAESRLCRPFFVILSTAEPNVEKSPKCGRYFDIRVFGVNREIFPLFDRNTILEVPK